ncbi:hypothetical protein NEUTE1DRAFT_98864 [Neurospora tetrasperma FGSC 2508]|uniref:Uncharacterized protein n=1 Tax=Neurospora tetrasperma (strain FGSC 2508 / ATCC MYA-4615 / P0657) TaxID=510951 RepID=F8MGE4_NEUT8|nr:uncharacterized protein NEUTE1DRAFT_98864 [Neurospora tetrasperma FGSC 2508]EGO58619.1 hypothetical protein NEUTE1DRAFT_98864 [Neurospora tetrasperma FGSC 2508]
MDPSNPATPAQQAITSLEHFRQIQAAEEAAAEAAAAAKGNTTAADFPLDPAEQCALIDQFVAALLNTDGIVDNYRHDPTENSEVKFVLGLPREKIVRKGWEVMDYDYKVQRGIIHPDAFCPELPNFMTRWRLTLSTFRKSKAACSDLFTLPYLWRYTCNPVAELEFGGSYETINNITTVRNAAGETIETLIKPQKRLLSEFLDDDLAAFAKAKRQRRVTGSSSTFGATSSSPAVAAENLPMIDKQLAHQQNQEGSGPFIVSNVLSSPEPGFANYSPLDQYQAPHHQQSLDGEFGYNSLDQYLTGPEPGADAGPLMWDQEHQQPDDFMDFFDLDEYIRRSQPIAGSSRDNGRSQAGEGSESADQSKN